MSRPEKSDVCEILQLISEEALILRTKLIASGTRDSSYISAALDSLEAALANLAACSDLCTATEKI